MSAIRSTETKKNTYIDPGVHRALKIHAAQHGVTMSEMLDRIICEAVGRPDLIPVDGQLANAS